MRNVNRSIPCLVVIGLALSAAGSGVAALGKWRPITAEEKALTSIEELPGAHAVLLYRSAVADDVQSKESHYYRIKVLTEEGKSHGDVEIPYLRGSRVIRSIEARTVQPDGTIVPFTGKVFDKLVVRVSGLKFRAKVFSFPDVRVGSILEYRFRKTWSKGLLYPPTWDVQSDLFTREAHFSFKPWSRDYDLSWSTRFLPAESQPQEGKGGRIELDISNVAAFEEEPYMPPESSLRSQVRFFYFKQRPKSVDAFWEDEGKDWNGVVENFIGKRGSIRDAVAETISPTDSDEEKIRKIYARVQQVRNLSYERRRTDEEKKREGIRDNEHVEDVWARSYGHRSQINRLFVALVRGAGFDADVVRVSERDVYFFQKNMLTWRQLDGEVSVIKLDGEDRWFDPGTPHCPMGMLSWQRTGVTGIRLDKKGGEFVQTPEPIFTDALVERTANLTLDETGTLEGTLTATFHGMEAVRRRLDKLDADEESATDDLEEEIESWLPSNARIEIQEIEGWESSEEPLKAVVKVEMPGFATPTGSRLLLTTGVFVANLSNPFATAKRVHPVYFRNPYQRTDELTITLPAGMQIENLPEKQSHRTRYGEYSSVAKEEDGKLRVERNFTMAGYFYPLAHYSSLRSFFSRMRTSDEEQAVLRFVSESTDE